MGHSKLKQFGQTCFFYCNPQIFSKPNLQTVGVFWWWAYTFYYYYYYYYYFQGECSNCS